MRLHLFFILSLLSITGIAQIPTWTGSLNSDWQTAANWNTLAVPASTDAVIINNSANQPVLDSPRSVASLTINSGAVLNLGSYNLTVSGSFTGNSATVNNGSLVTGSATVTNCTFGAKLTSIGGTIQLRNNTFNEKVTVTQTGSSNTTSYGNTFNDPTRLTNSSAGFLSFGVGVADVFNDSLFATVTASRALYLAHSSAGNLFNGYVEFNKTSTATSTGVLVGSQTHASIFKSVVLLKAAAGAITTQNASFTNCTFDSSASLSVSSGNFTHGQVSFSGCRIYPSVSITTGSTAQVQLTGGTIVYNAFTSVSPSVLLGAVDFKSTCSITKTGSSTDLSSGPVICRSTNLFKNTGTGLYWLGGAASNKFLQGLSVENTGAGTLQFTLTQATDSIVGTTSIAASSGVVVLGSVGTVNKPTLNGNITLNLTGGSVQLNSLKQSTSGSITASAFSGSLTLNDFKQLGTTAINLSGSGAFTVKSGTEIKGDLTVSAGRIYVMGGEFFEEVFLNQTGSLASQGEGTPIFHKDVEFKCSGTGAFQLNYPNTTFTYHEDLILNNASGGLQLGYIGTHTVKGDVIYKGAYNINSWSNKIVLNGTLNQSIKREHSFTPTVLRLEINKPSGTATLETPLIVALDLSLQKGELHTTATNFPTLGSTATITGGSDSSYVVGPISKIGTAAFTFPLGGNGSYAPLGIDAVASSCTFKANYIAEDPDALYPRSQKDTTLGFVNRCGYWNLDRTSGTQNTKVTLGWSNNPCFAPSPAEAKISRWDGNNWIDFGNLNFSGSNNIGQVRSSSSISQVSEVFSLASKCDLELSLNPLNTPLISGYLTSVQCTPDLIGQYAFKVNNDSILSNGSNSVFDGTLFNGDNLTVFFTNLDGCFGVDSINLIMIGDSLIMENFDTLQNSNYYVFSGGELLNSNVVDSIIVNEISGFNDLIGLFSFNESANLDYTQKTSFLNQLDVIEDNMDAITGKVIPGDGVLWGGVYTMDSYPQTNRQLKIPYGARNSIVLKLEPNTVVDSTLKIVSHKGDSANLIFYCKGKLIIWDNVDFQATLIADTIEFIGSSAHSRMQSSRLFAKSQIAFRQSDNPIWIQANNRLLSTDCIPYLAMCEQIGNGRRFDVSNFYESSMTPAEFNSGVVCGWLEHGSFDANIVGPITSGSDNSVCFWSWRNGIGSEGIQSDPSINSLNVNLNEDIKVSFNYKLDMTQYNSFQMLDRLFVILASTGSVSPSEGEVYNSNGSSFTEMPFNNIDYSFQTVNGLVYVNCTNPAQCGNESFVIIEKSDLDIDNNSINLELNNINGLTYSLFSRILNIDQTQVNPGSNFNRILIFPRNSSVAGRLGASYCQVDNISLNTCCPSKYQINGYQTTTNNFIQNHPLVQNNVLNTSLISPNTILNVDGFIEVVNNFTIQNSQIVLADNSTIYVRNGAVLNIVNSSLFGCRTLWTGIIVYPGGKLNVIGSDISDASEAIRGSNTPLPVIAPSDITISNSEFYDNITAIHLRGNRYVSQGLFPFSITGSVIGSASSQMLPVSESEWKLVLLGQTQEVIKPFMGIRLTGVLKVVKVGDASAQSNTISNCFIGIRADSSNVSIQNNSFNDIGFVPPTIGNYPIDASLFQGTGYVNGVLGSAILVNNPITSVVQSRSVSIGATGNSPGLPNSNFFEKCRNGIFLTGVRLQARVNSNFMKGFTHDGIVYLNTRECSGQIYDNRLENIEKRGIRFGANQRSNFNIFRNTVYNYFNTNQLLLTGFEVSNSFKPDSKFWIVDNLSSGCNIGFNLNGLRHYIPLQYEDEPNTFSVVDHNIAKINLKTGAIGFKLVNSPNCYFTQNTAMPITATALNFQTIGFDVSSSTNSQFICNTAADLNMGFSFATGNGSTTFAGNRMDNLRIGFQLFNTNIGIGNQGNGSTLHLNSWLPVAPPSPFTAHLRSSSSNGLNTRFNISQSCNLSTSYYNPANFISDLIGIGSNMLFGIPVEPCSTLIYFNYNDNSADRPTDCFRHGGFAEPGSYTPISESNAEEQYLQRRAMIFEPDTIGLPYFSSEMKMEARQLYYDLSLDTTASLPSVLIDFKDSLAQTDDGKVMIIQKFISSIDANADSVFTYNNLSNKIMRIDSISGISMTLTNFDPIIKREKLIYDWILSQKRSEVVIQRDYVNTVLNSSDIDSMHVLFVSDSKNYVYPSITMLDSIRNIANSCPYEWGEIVYICRALNIRFDTLAFIKNVCEYQEAAVSPRLGQMNESETIPNSIIQGIYPNPFSDQITFNCLEEDLCDVIRFELYDITGRLLFTENKGAVNGTYFIQTNQVPSGVFFLQLFDEDQLVKSFKMIKL